MEQKKKRVVRRERPKDEPFPDDFIEDGVVVPEVKDETNKKTEENGKSKVEKKVEKESPKMVDNEEIDEVILDSLNQAGDLFLECLPPGIKKDFHVACYKDFMMKDIGIFILGLLNRMYKMGDYYNPDIEPEWDRRIVGISKNLTCEHCGKLIPNPKNINQMYCDNVCAKKNKDKYSTGVLFPGEKDLGSEADQDEKAWGKEQKRLGTE